MSFAPRLLVFHFAASCVCFIFAACLSRPLMRALQVPFTVELMNSMVQKSKTYVLLDTKDVLVYLMPTVPAVRAILARDAIQHADDNAADVSSTEARSLVLVIIDLRVQRPPQQQQPHHLQQQHYQMSAQPAAAHGVWNGAPYMPPNHALQQLPVAVHSYTAMPGDNR